MVFRFDDCELDLDRVELRVGGEPRSIEPQVFDVLATLIRLRDRVVTKEELLDEVWHTRFVTESALTSRVKHARRAIGDDGKTQRLIRTVHGRGYQFVGEVQVEEAGPEGPRVRIPRPATTTVGREADIVAVLDLLGRARVVTLLGPGGVGKTRLAVEVALRHSEATGTAAVFVDLTKVRRGDHVTELIARELGIHASAGDDSGAALEEALRGRSMLLVLDNFEHVAERADIVADLVRESPDVCVLATSRARLRIAGEHVVDVAPLPFDDEADGAVALFLQVARAVDPGFSATTHLADVRHICRAVDGLPLAIELVASHVRTLPPAWLRARIGSVLGAASTGIRDAPDRQQTIPAMIDWSLDLLGPAEHALFERLGVFSGPVDLELVEQVCGPDQPEVVPTLARLVDQSLVHRVGDRLGVPRFTLLELVRERARDLLVAGGDEPARRDRHAEVVVDRLEDLERRRWSDASGEWIDAISDLLGEVRSAHEWSRSTGAHERAARIAASLGTYWHREGHHTEGRRWVEEALAHRDELDGRVVALLDLAAGFLAWPRDQAEAADHWGRSIDAFRALGDDRYLAYALGLSSGSHIGDLERYGEAMARCDEALGIARTVGDRPLIAQILNVQGELARVHGDDDLAHAAYVEGEALAVAAGDRAHQSVFLANLAYLAAHRGDPVEARRLATEALRLCWSLGRRMMAAWTVSELAGPELDLGRPERAARFLGAGEGALRVLGVTRHPGDVPEHERVLDALRAALGEEALRTLRAEGATLPLEQAVSLALSEPGPGHEARAEDRGRAH